ncbi:bifunctional serine/threonine-protein kinase/formylglycine-generating enzyme family protein [Pseudanabaena sp. ABRG5-3]|uniref:bifunctional serine/threonine-protein kinase/formylglycine-generating enzyme family protein n=1 Tax=Pseudanabaena sp. ABRG5-3 TaxID=685565 RepID=UPI000DC716BF|nr:bifunctional serine/threonine-protein kinase/formylglycine-generating enzyme family protein [Pseudanabaena sp. ABRG5-3]BBC22642.1 serine/threonine protein kinase [Pseudanabaena sp. ABRG5-3]
MSQCLNPNCNYQNPERSPRLSFCQQCGSNLKIGDRYRALRILGQGGFGRTFIGIDEALPSCPTCVIKQFFPADLDSAVKAAELFHQEAIRLDDLGKHPQIPTLFAHLEHDGRQYLIQEFIDGQDLLKELQDQGAFSEAKIRMLLTDLLPILQFIHDRNVIHRDIKPENIIRRRFPSNSDSVVAGNHVLVDFGAAKYVSSSAMMQTGTRIGSAVYVSPEQVRGKAIFASDIYSLGVTCIHLLTNVSPFDLMDMDGNWIWRDFLGDNSVNPVLGEILDRMILSAPSQRYQTAQGVLNDLKNVNSPSHQAYVPQFARQNSQRAIAKTKITPVTAPKPLIPAIAPQLSQFSFETATVTINPTRNQVGSLVKHLGIAKLYSAQLQIITKQKIGYSYFETLGNIQGKPIGLEMVFIPAGKFQIGSPVSESDRNKEESPRHVINIPSFFMSRFQITQRQWKVLMDNNPAIFIGNVNRPVESVSWDDVQIFCQKLVEHTGKPYRLPSESEWEYACRAGTITPFCFGETIAANLATYNGAIPYQYAPQGITNSTTTEVGSYPANAFGLHDMHGNVWEWCEDTWHDDYDLLPKDGKAWTQGGDRSCRVVRGGSWRDPAHYCRSAKRYRNVANQGDRTTGFRLAVMLKS